MTTAIALILTIIGTYRALFGRPYKCAQCNRRFHWLSKDGLCEQCMVENSIEAAFAQEDDGGADYFNRDNLSWKVLGTSEESMFEIAFSEDDEGSVVIGTMPSSGQKEDVTWKKLGIG